MDLAHIIKGLLTVECSFRITHCAVTNTLRGAFLFWGWQPSFLLKFIAPAVNVVGKREMLNNVTGNTVLDMIDECLYEQDNTTDISEGGRPYSIWLNGSNEDIEDLKRELSTIQAVCFFPASLQMFTTFGITIFLLFTGIVR